MPLRLGGDAVRRQNFIAIRVEDKNGQGGLTKRCFLKYGKNKRFALYASGDMWYDSRS